MQAVLSILTSGGFGAITGLLGGWLAKRETRKSLELQYNHEQAMGLLQVQEAQAEREQALALGDQNMALAEVQGQQVIEERTVDAFKSSIESQGKSTGKASLDFVLRLIRPLITAWLLYMMAGIYGKLDKLTGGLKTLPIPEQVALYMTIVDAIIFLTTVAVGWWFASRKGQLK